MKKKFFINFIAILLGLFCGNIIGRMNLGWSNNYFLPEYNSLVTLETIFMGGFVTSGILYYKYSTIFFNKNIKGFNKSIIRFIKLMIFLISFPILSILGIILIIPSLIYYLVMAIRTPKEPDFLANISDDSIYSCSKKCLILKHSLITKITKPFCIANLLCIICTIVFYRKYILIPLFVLFIILALILNLKHRKNMNKILPEECDPKTYLELMKIDFKKASEPNLKKLFSLNMCSCHLLIGDYDKAYNILKSIDINTLSHTLRWLFVTQFCNFYFCKQDLDKFEEYCNKFIFTDNYFKNESQNKIYLNSIKTLQIYKANFDNNLVLERELLDSTKSELQFPMEWVKYNYSIGIIDIKEGNYQEATEKFSYVIEHGNTTKYVSLARQALNLFES